MKERVIKWALFLPPHARTRWHLINLSSFTSKQKKVNTCFTNCTVSSLNSQVCVVCTGAKSLMGLQNWLFI